MTRHLRQPGPASAARIESFATDGRRLDFTLQAGSRLNDALTAPLVAAGMTCATLRFAGARLHPFAYVIPHPAPDAAHVAYFSPPRTPPGGAVIQAATATFGWREGAPLVHCHAAWIEADGTYAGGHILPHETIVADRTTVAAWAASDVAIEATPDAETNFTLFAPRARPGVGADGGDVDGGDMIVARIRPNQDILEALAATARRHGLPRATIRGSLGSLIGARFTDGRCVDDIATEILVLQGTATPDAAQLEILAVDMMGVVHRGWLARGENPVCITFEAVLEAG